MYIRCSKKKRFYYEVIIVSTIVIPIFNRTQITRYGSPCLDLGHYFFTSIKPEVRRAHYKDLLKIYYDQFVKTSELLESKCPLPFEVRLN